MIRTPTTIWRWCSNTKVMPRRRLKAFQAALRLKPSWADAHYGLGATYYDLKNLQAHCMSFARR